MLLKILLKAFFNKIYTYNHFFRPYLNFNRIFLIQKQTLLGSSKAIGIQMYILASDFFEKDDKYVFNARNSCCL